MISFFNNPFRIALVVVVSALVSFLTATLTVSAGSVESLLIREIVRSQTEHRNPRPKQNLEQIEIVDPLPKPWAWGQPAFTGAFEFHAIAEIDAGCNTRIIHPCPNTHDEVFPLLRETEKECRLNPRDRIELIDGYCTLDWN